MSKESKIYNLPFRKVYNASLRALQASGFQIKDQKPTSIKASSPADIRSWGEDIQVILTTRSSGVEVRVTSLPIAQIFDWGKNKENITKFRNNLEKILAETKE